jgi:hypothetical protein
MDGAPANPQQPVPTLPGALDHSRDSDLSGRHAHPWIRRVILALLCLLVLAALLNLFGQEPVRETARGGGATLGLEAPTALRGGLVFQTRVEIEATDRAIGQPTLFLSDGWFDSVTLNAISPEPTGQKGEADGVTWQFGPLAAGDSFTVWAEWQVNPSRVGSGRHRLELRDGELPLTSINHSIRSFP